LSNIATTTPRRISPVIVRLCAALDPTQTPRYVPVRPDPDAKVQDCFFNVRTSVERRGGRLQFGWTIWEWPSTLVEGEFHAVWVSPDGMWVDVSPKPDGESRILFLPDSKREFDFETREHVDNVRWALTDHPGVAEYIRLTERRVALVSLYRRLPEPRPDVLDAFPELSDILLTLNELAVRLRRRSVAPTASCPCGSRKKHKRCCGRSRRSGSAPMAIARRHGH
jgi:hypothetical protein